VFFGTLANESHQKKKKKCFTAVWPSYMISQAKVPVVEAVMASYMLKKKKFTLMPIIIEKHNQTLILGGFLKLQISPSCLMSMFSETVVPQTCTLKPTDWTLDACSPNFYIFVIYIHK
jgi:hypothetical protein